MFVVLALQLLGYQDPVEAGLALLHQNCLQLVPQPLDLGLLGCQGVLEAAVLSQQMGIVPEDYFCFLLELKDLAAFVFGLGVLDFGLHVPPSPVLCVEGGTQWLN